MRYSAPSYDIRPDMVPIHNIPLLSIYSFPDSSESKAYILIGEAVLHLISVALMDKDANNKIIISIII